MARRLDRPTILAEAKRQFARHGFKKASLAAIAAGLGASKTAVYHHFPRGKDELVEACLRTEEEQIFAAMQAAVDACADPREQLHAAVVTKLRCLRTLRERLDISPTAGRELIGLYQEHRRRFNMFEEDLLAGILARGERAGVFRRTDTRKLASVLRVNLQHLEVPIVFEMEPSRLDEHVDTLMDLVLHGLVTRDLRGRARPRAASPGP